MKSPSSTADFLEVTISGPEDITNLTPKDFLLWSSLAARLCFGDCTRAVKPMLVAALEVYSQDINTEISLFVGEALSKIDDSSFGDGDSLEYFEDGAQMLLDLWLLILISLTVETPQAEAFKNAMTTLVAAVHIRLDELNVALDRTYKKYSIPTNAQLGTLSYLSLSSI